jgi:glycerophosphoryl diester phosphodiesterase
MIKKMGDENQKVGNNSDMNQQLDSEKSENQEDFERNEQKVEKQVNRLIRLRIFAIYSIFLYLYFSYLSKTLWPDPYTPALRELFNYELDYKNFFTTLSYILLGYNGIMLYHYKQSSHHINKVKHTNLKCIILFGVLIALYSVLIYSFYIIGWQRINIFHLFEYSFFFFIIFILLSLFFAMAYIIPDVVIDKKIAQKVLIELTIAINDNKKEVPSQSDNNSNHNTGGKKIGKGKKKQKKAIPNSLKGLNEVKTPLKVKILVLGALLLVILPVFTPTSNIYSGDLPPKPKIIGHRGGASIAPENTLAAFELISSLGADGIEIDVQISADGVPFLMHDLTLERTTNIAKIFPNRTKEPASNFTISELLLLDAGTWYVDADPFNSIANGIINNLRVKKYYNISIPTLSETIEYAKSKKFILNIDFKRPFSGHPFESLYFNSCMAVLSAANYSSNIWIATGNQEYLNNASLIDPDFVLALGIGRSTGLELDSFLTGSYDMLNSDHRKSNAFFKKYIEAGVPINVYTMNYPERFAQLWCMGIDYVTTDYPQDLIPMTLPIWSIADQYFYIVLGIIYMFGLIVIKMRIPDLNKMEGIDQIISEYKHEFGDDI